MYTGHAVFPFPHNWVEELLETLEWRTDVLQGQTGMEQRVPRRLAPRRGFEASFLLDKDSLRAFQTFYERHAALEFVLPIWHDVRPLQATNPGDSLSFSVSVIDTELDTAPFIILRGEEWYDWEVYSISSTLDYTVVVTNNGLTEVDSPWPGNTRVYPGALARFEEVPQYEKVTDQNMLVTVKFLLSQPLRHPSVPDFDVFGDYPVLILPPDESDGLTADAEVSHSVVDNGLSLRRVYDNVGRPAKRMEYRWSVVGGQNLKQLRNTFHWLRGRTRALLVPTFVEDLKTVSPVVAGGNTIEVSNVGYALYQMHTHGRQRLCFTLSDGTILYRNVTAAAPSSEDSDLLTLDATWPYNLTAQQIKRISYLIPCRLDQDLIEISHPTDTVGVSHSKVTWREVFGPIGTYEAGVIETSSWRAEMVDPDVPTWGDLGISGEEDTEPAEIYFMDFVEELDRVVLVSLESTISTFGAVVALLDPVTLELDRIVLPMLQGFLPDRTQTEIGLGSASVPFRHRAMVYSRGYLVFTGYYESSPTSWDFGYMRVNATTGAWDFYPEQRVALPPGTEWYFPSVDFPGHTISTRSAEFLWVNPYDGDIYSYTYESFVCLLRFDVTNMETPKQVYAFVTPYVDPLSEFGNYYGSLVYSRLPDRTVIDEREQATLYVSNLFFADADTAYMQDFRDGRAIVSGHKNDLYKINLASGVARFQFSYYPVAETRNAPSNAGVIGLDPLTATLWISTPGGLFAWVIGSSPETLRFYQHRLDRAIRPHGTQGLQSFAHVFVAHAFHLLARKIWEIPYVYSGNSNAMLYDGVGWAADELEEYMVWTNPDNVSRVEGRSMDTREVDAVMRSESPDLDTVFDSGDPTTYSVEPRAFDIQFVSPTLGWEFRVDWNELYGEIRRFIRYSFVGERPPPPVVRFVRITILANRHWRTTSGGTNPDVVLPPGVTTASPGYVGLQGLELHRSPYGRPLPIASITASSADVGYPVSNLLDGDYVNPENSWRSSGETYPKTLTVELVDPAPVYEVMLWPVNSRENSPSLFGAGQYRKMGPEVAPDTFIIETSEDGVSWGNQQYFYGMEGGWSVAVDGMDEAYLAVEPDEPLEGPIQFAYESVFLTGPRVYDGMSPSAGRAFEVF